MNKYTDILQSRIASHRLSIKMNRLVLKELEWMEYEERDTESKTYEALAVPYYIEKIKYEIGYNQDTLDMLEWEYTVLHPAIEKLTKDETQETTKQREAQT